MPARKEQGGLARVATKCFVPRRIKTIKFIHEISYFASNIFLNYQAVLAEQRGRKQNNP